MKGKLKDGRDNLRGRKMIAIVEGVRYRVVVVTHIRGGRWLVGGLQLPRKYSRWGGVIRRAIVWEEDLSPRC